VKLKLFLRSVLNTLGYQICDSCTIGVSLTSDLNRLTSDHSVQTIFDIGGNFGQSAIEFAQAFKKANIYTFEPYPTSFEKLKNETKGNHRIKPFNLAIGSRNGEMPMFLGDHSGSNTLVKTNDLEPSAIVPISTLQTFSEKYSINQVDFLKVDVEGFEMEVLHGGDEMFQEGQIRYCSLECVFSEDTTQPHTTFFEILEFLKNRGYVFICCYTESFNLQHGISMGNVLFAHKNSLPHQAKGRVRNIF